MNVGELTAKIQANKKPLAIAGAAGVAGLALLQRRKAGGDLSTGSTPAAGPSVSSGGSLATPNGQVVYSSTGSDVYNALQPQLATIGNAVGQLVADKSAADKDSTIPIASTLFNPNGTGNYIGQANGLIAEIQSDGSLFGVTRDQWLGIIGRNGGKIPDVTAVDSFGAPAYSTGGNVAAAAAKLAK